MIETIVTNKKKKLILVKYKYIVVMNDDSDDRDDEEVTLPGLNKGLIFVNESLTYMNRTLLKEAKTISKNLHYKYTGYTFNIHFHISITCKKDLEKIT